VGFKLLIPIITWHHSSFVLILVGNFSHSRNDTFSHHCHAGKHNHSVRKTTFSCLKSASNERIDFTLIHPVSTMQWVTHWHYLPSSQLSAISRKLHVIVLYNTNICNAHSVSKHTESDAQAVARWGGWREWSVKCYLNTGRYVLKWRLKVGRVEQSLWSYDLMAV